MDHFAMGLEITVVDDRIDPTISGPAKATGWMAAATRSGEIAMTSIKQVVTDILSRIGAGTPDAKKIARLNILDHGSPGGFEMGDDYVSMGTLPYQAVEFAKLRPHFAKGGIAHLQHCEIGQNTQLVAALATLLDVPVYAGVGAHNPVYRINLGGGFPWIENYICCYPDGRVVTYAARPDVIDPGDIKVPLMILPGSVRIWDR